MPAVPPDPPWIARKHLPGFVVVVVVIIRPELAPFPGLGAVIRGSCLTH